MKNRIIILLLLLGSICHAQKAKVYELKKGLDYGIGGACLVLGIADYRLSNNLIPLKESQILALDVDDLPSIDRKASRQYSPRAKDMSDIFEYAVFLAPAPLLLSSDMRREARAVFVMYVEAFSFNLFSNQFVKYSTKRIRPYVYNRSVDIAAKRSKNARKSFYSGHVSHTATMSVFTAKVFSDLFPNSNWKPAFWVASLAIPITTGYLRYKAGQHYPTDVAAGLVAGSLIGYLVPALHKAKNTMPDGWSLETSHNGLSMCYTF